MQTLHSFVLYRLPREDKYHLIVDDQPRSIHDLSTFNDEAFIIAPFDADSKSLLWAFSIKDSKVLTVNDISQLKIEFPTKPSEYKPYIASQKEHENNVEEMVSIIKTGEIGKGVLSRIKPIKRKGEPLQELFLELTRKYPNAFVYLTLLPNGEVWCGASPEVLAKYQNNKFETMALAGTQLLRNKKLDDLVWEEKEKQEQKWVQDHLSNIFSNLKIDSKKSDTYSSQAGHLAHLRNDYWCDVNTHEARNILLQLHPTPAICGTPTSKAKEIILQLEAHDRAYYSGYIGLYSPQQFHLFVNLRCMLITNKTYYLFVGGGITADSIAEKEWLETESKADVLGRVISGRI